MRTVFFVRHGIPEDQDIVRRCLGTTDVQLGNLGKLQATLAGLTLEGKSFSAVYCSKLLRSRQTAELIGSPVIAVPGLEEMFAGEWDGLTFDEIRKKWPDYYEQRGRRLSMQPPGGETNEDGLKRFSSAVNEVMSRSDGDIVVVAHASVTQVYLCSILGRPIDEARTLGIPYGSVSTLVKENKYAAVKEYGTVPHPELGKAACDRLLDSIKTPQNIKIHSAAVFDEASEIADVLKAAGVKLDKGLVMSAALLHDIARREENHADLGAYWLRNLGYEMIADIIEQHHDLKNPMEISETSVVYIADKIVSGDRHVALDERFEASREKCRTQEAITKHHARYCEAVTVKNRINEICGKDVIK